MFARPDALVVGAVVAKLPIAVGPQALGAATVEDRAGVLATGRQGQPVGERVWDAGRGWEGGRKGVDIAVSRQVSATRFT